MLHSTLLPVEISPALAAYTLTSREAVTALMIQLCGDRFPLTCFIAGGYISAEARIDQVLPDDSALALIAASEVEQDLLEGAQAITAVGVDQGVKIQFSSTVKGTVQASGGMGVQVSMPTAVLRLQRRRFDRVKPSRMAPLECMVRGKANMPTLQRLPVLDINLGGVALLSRHAADTFDVGQRLFNCSFPLGSAGEIVADLVVRNVERLDASRGRRYGCAFVEISDEALATLRHYIERLEALKNGNR